MQDKRIYAYLSGIILVGLFLIMATRYYYCSAGLLMKCFAKKRVVLLVMILIFVGLSVMVFWNMLGGV